MPQDHYAYRLAELREQLSELGPRLCDPSLTKIERVGIVTAMMSIGDAIEAIGEETERN